MSIVLHYKGNKFQDFGSFDIKVSFPDKNHQEKKVYCISAGILAFPSFMGCSSAGKAIPPSAQTSLFDFSLTLLDIYI